MTLSQASIALQVRSFAASLGFSLAWIACALAGEDKLCIAIALVAAVGYGVSMGAWMVREMVDE